MRIVRTTITIEQHRETVIREVRYGGHGVQDSQSPIHPESNVGADTEGSVIDVSPMNDKTTAAELKP